MLTHKKSPGHHLFTCPSDSSVTVFDLYHSSACLHPHHFHSHLAASCINLQPSGGTHSSCPCWKNCHSHSTLSASPSGLLRSERDLCPADGCAYQPAKMRVTTSYHRTQPKRAKRRRHRACTKKLRSKSGYGLKRDQSLPRLGSLAQPFTW